MTKTGFILLGLALFILPIIVLSSLDKELEKKDLSHYWFLKLIQPLVNIILVPIYVIATFCIIIGFFM